MLIARHNTKASVARSKPALRWLLSLLALMLCIPGALAQVVITNVTVANITPSSFSVVWANTPGTTPSISVYSDPDGLTNLVGQVGIEYFPLNTGDPTVTNASDRRLDEDALRQQTMNLGVASVRISHCLPNTTYYFSLLVTNGVSQAVYPASGPLLSVTTAQANAFATQSEELVITLIGATSGGYIVTLSNSNSTSVLAATSGDGTASNKVFFALSDLIGNGGTNFTPGGTQQFTATVVGLPFSLGTQTYNITYPTNFSVTHDDDVTLVLSNAPAQPPSITCPSDIVTNLVPCETNVSVAFSPTATGFPFPTVICMLGTNVIGSPFAFPAGTNLVTCIASNSVGTNSCSFNVIVAPAPTVVAGTNVTLGVQQGVPVNIPAGKLAYKGYSPSDNPLTIVAVTSPTPGGATVTLTNGIITYSPPSNLIAQDSFSYTLSDGCSSALGTVTVNITPSTAGSHNVISITVTGTSRVLEFAGIPGQSYTIQWAPTPSGAWTNLTTSPIQANAYGVIQYTDTTFPVPSQRYYRTASVSP